MECSLAQVSLRYSTNYFAKTTANKRLQRTGISVSLIDSLPHDIVVARPLKRNVMPTWRVQNDMGAAQQATNKNPFRLLMHVPVPWVFVLAYLIGVGLQYAWPPHLATVALPGVSITGGVLFGIGAAIAGWGLLTFRRARTTTVPGRVSSQLVTWGPYRFSRNPMYVGLA
jgi:protein-S-isoprenylcysteine O-methyltransferase Ste14